MDRLTTKTLISIKILKPFKKDSNMQIVGFGFSHRNRPTLTETFITIYLFVLGTKYEQSN